MSDLWNRCRSALRAQVSTDDWRRSIEPLRAWIDADILYLWVDRDDDDWRSIPNPAKDFDRLIRGAVREVYGRAPRDVRYLVRPPNREKLITERRVGEHREAEHAAQARERAALDAIKAEVYEQVKAEVLRDPRILGSCRDERDVGVKIQRMVMDRAKHRHEFEVPQSQLRPFQRREAPRDPPWPPDPAGASGEKTPF